MDVPEAARGRHQDPAVSAGTVETGSRDCLRVMVSRGLCTKAAKLASTGLKRMGAAQSRERRRGSWEEGGMPERTRVRESLESGNILFQATSGVPQLRLPSIAYVFCSVVREKRVRSKERLFAAVVVGGSRWD